MKSEWYGDKRDIVKWSAMLDLATKEQLKGILQIPISDNVPSPGPKLQCVGLKRHGIAANVVTCVQNYFHLQRDLKKIIQIAKKCSKNIKITIYPPRLSGNGTNLRKSYFTNLGKVLKKVPENNGTLFLLDPDVGILQAAKIKHVTPAEVVSLWNNLNQGNWLGLYQHAHHKTTWVNDQRKIYKSACKGHKSFVSYHSNPKNKGWRDSAIFAAKK